MSTDVSLHNEAEILAAIKSVRDDKQAIDWVVVGHKDGNPNVLDLQATGTDGFVGLKAKLDSTKVQYALLRVTAKVDMSVTVKFVYIYNLGEKVGFMIKGKMGVVKGQAMKFFQPYHVDFAIESANEITSEMIDSKVKAAAGTADNVRDASFIEGKQERGYTTRSTAPIATSKSNDSLNSKTLSATNIAASAQPLAKPTAATQSTGVAFDDDLIDQIKQVRNDKSDVKWVVGAYKDGELKNPITLVASGSTGVDDMKNAFKPDSLSYGLIRVVDVIDGHPTTKFVFCQWIGNDVSVMKKAKVSTHKGAVSEKFAPFHVDFTISEKREISDAIVLSKVQGFSGSKSFVK